MTDAATLPRSAARDVLGRPLLFALFLGCTVSALAAGRFTIGLILDGAISFAFVPAIHVAALAFVHRLTRDRSLPIARAIDRFFSGSSVWLLWMIGVSAIGSVVPPRQIGPWLLPLLASLLLPLAWSLWTDFHFFREVMHRSPAMAVRDLVLQRTIAWIGITLYFLYNSMWPLEQALRP